MKAYSKEFNEEIRKIVVHGMNIDNTIKSMKTLFPRETENRTNAALCAKFYEAQRLIKGKKFRKKLYVQRNNLSSGAEELLNKAALEYLKAGQYEVAKKIAELI